MSLKPLRPYQEEAIDAVEGAWVSHRATLLVMPTGTGKTRTFTEILRRRKPFGRALVLAHRQELLTQAGGALQMDGGLTWELERAEHWASIDTLIGSTDAVVATVQTMKGRRLKRWPADAFATVVVDEAHHAAAKSYRTILDHFPHAKVLGVTATPDRGDGVGLGNIFESVAYQYEIRTAIKAGYLVPIVQKTIECADLDISHIRSRAGDLAQNELEQALSLDAVHHQIAGPLVALAGDRPTIVFCAGVAQAHALGQVLGGYTKGSRVAVVDGATPTEEREGTLARYAAGEVQFLINCAVLTEGFDAPATACVAMARPTESRALYTQCVGRGTRIAPGKQDLLVLDFVGNAGKHTLITPLDVLAGKDLPDEVKADAERGLADGLDAEEALERAERWAKERARRDAEERREARVRAEVAYRMQEVSPFRLLGDAPQTDKGPRATDGQLRALEKFGVKPEELKVIPSRRAASQMIEALVDRSKKNLCSYRQARVLGKHGLRTDVSFREAKQIIDAMQANRWRVPPQLAAQYAKEGSSAA